MKEIIGLKPDLSDTVAGYGKPTFPVILGMSFSEVTRLCFLPLVASCCIAVARVVTSK